MGPRIESGSWTVSHDIEREIDRLKGTLAVVTRFDGLFLHFEATVLIAEIGEWL